ncbi:myb DNA-binding protein [Grosmannia clavigera kw1407]|uniref:Myb DNA-binding protein n=1 Tax=Grosmannia clavigera (strain kw1407 / UAMH 11150) TaxID=655863 RepID=F0X6T3_GROCL|nr:myb DNA-binding protein [Grosmannia clavigera kw1407]EFX06305.1 myb DNA-binding protein [Grosmannia clavigera kw1407]
MPTQSTVDSPADFKEESMADHMADHASLADNLFESLQNALKRQWSDEPDMGADGCQTDAKRIKDEPQDDLLDEPGWDIGALLESALGSMDQLAGAPMAASIGNQVGLGTADVSAMSQMDMSPVVTTAEQRGVTKPGVPASAASDSHTAGASSREQNKMRFSQNPTYIVRSMGLSMLGSLAVQILHALSERPRPEGLSNLTSADTETGRCYRALRATFCCARKMFSDSSALLIPEELDIKELGDQETIQMANMATICASVFDADDVSLIDMHDHFLMTFLPESNALTEDLATLFLGLKFRTIAGEFQRLPDDQQRGDFLERLFPADLEDQLKQLHPDVPLSDQELAFLREMMAAKDLLLEAAKTEQSRSTHLHSPLFLWLPRLTVTADELTEKYPLDSFRNELSAFLETNADIVLKYAETHSIEIPTEEESVSDEQAMSDALAEVSANLASMFAMETDPPAEAAPPAPQTAGITAVHGGDMVDAIESTSMSEGLSKFIQEAVQKSASAAQTNTQTATENGTSGSTGEADLSGLTMLLREKLNQETQNAQAAQTHSPVTAANAALTSMQNTYANQLALFQSRTPSFTRQPIQPPVTETPGGANGSLPPNQTSPSAVLYQRARQAAAAKTTAHARREGLHSTRRPWTPDEEQALMAGLDMVKGPHWSQILQLFGANGTISDILKDRSQVQLKDKARNLKLFFLKTNSEMPYYLHCVTGELKTRAPGQAARKEAEERARSNNEEEQARVRGIMTLAGGLQDNKTGAATATDLGTARTTGAARAQPAEPQAEQNHNGSTEDSASAQHMLHEPVGQAEAEPQSPKQESLEEAIMRLKELE